MIKVDSVEKLSNWLPFYDRLSCGFGAKQHKSSSSLLEPVPSWRTRGNSRGYLTG
jgi:hypothetical protein